MFYRNGIITLIICISSLLFAKSEAAGLLTPVNSQHKTLEIKTHDVHILMQDGYAITQIDQIFFNANQQDLEAHYSFPIPEGAAVGEFTYWINGSPVTGEVVEKIQAEQIYQQQKQQGRHTGVTSQDGYQSFNVKIFPVPAQDTIKIRLVYFQQQAIDTGIGRYVYPLEEGGVDKQKDSFWSRNAIVTERFSFNMDIRSSYPLDGIRLPSHSAATLEQVNASHWRISYQNGEASDENKEHKQQGENAAPTSTQFSLDKDIVVYWRHQQDLPGSLDLVTYRAENKKQGTFMLTLTPGDDLAPNSGNRDWVFILDKSGSMNGKYATLIEGVRQGLAKLPRGDRFRIITFNDNSDDITSGYQIISDENVSRALDILTSRGVGGGTNLYAGLKRGLIKLDDDRSSAVILVTDGVANVGITEKKAFLKLLDKRDVRLYTFIMGNSANRPLLEGMTKKSNGFFASISNADDIMGQIMLATSKMTHQAMRDITLDIDGVRVSDISPNKIETLYRGQQLTVIGHYFGSGQATVKLSGMVDGQRVKYQTNINFPVQQTSNPELERLWAYSQINDLQGTIDYLGDDRDIKQAIIDLSIAYSIVTNYTSLLVVEPEVFKSLGIEQNNKQRITREHAAKKRRKQQVVTSNRADKQQPMFKNNRPSTGGGGGGASGPLWLLILLSLMLIRTRYSVNKQ